MYFVFLGDVAALVRPDMNGLQPFESTIEQTTETMSPSHKTITAAAMSTNRITSLQELLHFWFSSPNQQRQVRILIYRNRPIEMCILN